MPATRCTQPGLVINSLDLASALCLGATTRQRLTNGNKLLPKKPLEEKNKKTPVERQMGHDIPSSERCIARTHRARRLTALPLNGT